MPLSYRRPNIDEVAAFAELHVQCWREAFTEILPADLVATFDAAQRVPMWQRCLADEKRIVVGAYDNGKPVGFIIAGKPLEHLLQGTDGQIDTIYIAASHYRMGIGRQLIGRAARAWQEQGGHAFTLGVLAENIRARSFYESLGAKLALLTTYNWGGYDLPDAIYVFDDLPKFTP